MKIKYQLPSIGEGGFGRVYAACTTTSSEESRIIALKKIRTSKYVANPSSLHEACGLVLARGHSSIPEVFGWGQSQFYEYLATELLGCDLVTKFKDHPLTRRNFVSLVLQMFAAVAHVHSRGIIHCDIKPDHFLFGTGENSGSIYLIDFNLWAPWSTMSSSEPRKFKHLDKAHAARGFRGTIRYASVDCQLDRVLSRKDDMESLAYTIFDLYADALPWSSIDEDDYAEIVKLKQAWHMAEGCLQGSCEYPIGDFASYAWSLVFGAKPDYQHWRKQFWKVDNPATPLPTSGPLYDPDDTTEKLPRDLGFITEGPGGRMLRFYLPVNPNGGRACCVSGSNHGWVQASEGWDKPHSMLDGDVLRGEQEMVVRAGVAVITEPPTTTRPHLGEGCPPEEMRIPEVLSRSRQCVHIEENIQGVDKDHLGNGVRRRIKGKTSGNHHPLR